MNLMTLNESVKSIMHRITKKQIEPFNKIAKSTYYVRKLENLKSNLKSTLRVLNEVKNVEISDPAELPIANRFCNYFSSPVPLLLRK